MIPSPWTRGDASAVVVLGVGGAAGQIVCWWGVSAEANWHHQLTWVAGAVMSLALAGLGVCLWLYRGRLRVRRAAAEAWADLRVRAADRDDLFARWQNARTAGPSAGVSSPGWVSSPTMTRYHDAACALVLGKADLAVTTQADIARRGLRGCGVCAE
jgi:hypothetical protein